MYAPEASEAGTVSVAVPATTGAPITPPGRPSSETVPVAPSVTVAVYVTAVPYRVEAAPVRLTAEGLPIRSSVLEPAIE